MIPSRQLNSVKPVRVVKNYRELWLVVDQRKAWEKERCTNEKGQQRGIRFIPLPRIHRNPSPFPSRIFLTQDIFCYTKSFFEVGALVLLLGDILIDL